MLRLSGSAPKRGRIIGIARTPQRRVPRRRRAADCHFLASGVGQTRVGRKVGWRHEGRSCGSVGADGRRQRCHADSRARSRARRLLQRNISARLRAAGRRARADSARGLAGAGADRARHAFDGRDRQRRSVLLHFPARRARRSRSCRPQIIDQRVIAVYFDRNRRVQRARGIRHQGRPRLRFHQPHHADGRQPTTTSSAASCTPSKTAARASPGCDAGRAD